VNGTERRETPLDHVMDVFELEPKGLLAVTNRIAREEGLAPISRTHLFRLRKGLCQATEEKILLLVSALRELTGAVLRATDLFRLEPAAAGYASAVTPVSLTAVVAGASTSDSEFETLYVEYGVLLRTIAMRGFGISPDDAEALVHDCFIAYLERHTTIHDVKGWLSGAMRNHCRHYLRDRKREAPLGPEHDETADPAPQAAMDAWMRRLTLASVLARLGAKCRETLRGYYLSEEPKDALANRLSTSTGYIDQLLSTCRRRAHEMFRSLTASRKDRS
jgi:RNA polymerase sigma factor (sigma-70 family)